jgi:CRP-like cAMP-binding protein
METRHAGTELVREGQALDAPMLLLEGWAVRQRILPDGQRQIFGFVLPGDPIGLCDRPDGHAIAATMALTDVTVAAMPVLAEALWRRIGALHQWGRDRLSLEERGLYDQVVRLGRQSAYQRLVHLILDFYYRLSHAGLAQDRGFAMPLTQEVLSDALGLSTVHTNRTLQQLRREGMIESHGQHVRLLDIGRLAQISDYHPPRRLKLAAA